MQTIVRDAARAEEVLVWLRERGAFVDPRLTVFDDQCNDDDSAGGRRGVGLRVAPTATAAATTTATAIAGVAVGEVLLAVPHTLCLRSALADATAASGRGDNELARVVSADGVDVGPFVKLVVVLLREVRRHRGGVSTRMVSS